MDFFPVPYKQRQAREMIDAGASLIVGARRIIPTASKITMTDKLFTASVILFLTNPIFTPTAALFMGLKLTKTGRFYTRKCIRTAFQIRCRR
ncbi:MAG: hypothetical protein R3C26_07075 [Calditrichia bacterium]